MSKKYYEKLLAGTGKTSKVVKSKFAEKLMMNMGREQGKGLGKHETGMKECIQVERRDDGTGLGQENEDTDKNKTKNFKWNDAFWTNMYNSNAKKFGEIKGGKQGSKLIADDSSSESSSDDEDKKSTGSSSSSFDGEVVIIKESSSLMKSKKIKKDKCDKDKKDKKKSKDKKSKKKSKD